MTPASANGMIVLLGKWCIKSGIASSRTAADEASGRSNWFDANRHGGADVGAEFCFAPAEEFEPLQGNTLDTLGNGERRVQQSSE